MEKLLSTQLENSQEIKNIIRQLDITVKLAEGESVETLLTYLPCKDGVCDHTDLFHEIKKKHHGKFCFFLYRN